jgi:hypothetical protein
MGSEQIGSLCRGYSTNTSRKGRSVKPPPGFVGVRLPEIVRAYVRAGGRAGGRCRVRVLRLRFIIKPSVLSLSGRRTGVLGWSPGPFYFEVFAAADMSQGREFTGSTSASSAPATPGSFIVADFRPPPARRDRPASRPPGLSNWLIGWHHVRSLANSVSDGSGAAGHRCDGLIGAAVDRRPDSYGVRPSSQKAPHTQVARARLALHLEGCFDSFAKVFQRKLHSNRSNRSNSKQSRS